MRPPGVEEVMSAPPHSIDEMSTGAETLRKMRENGTKMILVTSKGAPKGVLEAWKITSLDEDKPIKYLELSDFRTVPLGTMITDLTPWPGNLRAVYVVGQNNQLVGVVTQYDLRKGYWSSLA